MTHILLAIIYLAFISLGLPDALLGSSWPTMHQEFAVPLSYAGGISFIIALGTIFSSLQSDRLTRKLGTSWLTALSVATTAIALFGFSMSHSYIALCLWAIPYGLGAGSVDASLNNYVALHYESKHMSWLHMMWGVGASIGPYILGYVLTHGFTWNMGYRSIGFIQIVLTVALFASLPLWKGQKPNQQAEENKNTKPLSLKEVLALPGAKAVMLYFFGYCAIEQTVILWASSYLNGLKGIEPATAAFYAGLFYIGITVGRGISGFVTMKLNDDQMMKLGKCIIVVGIVLLFLPLGNILTLIGLLLIGLGCAPIYPSVIHSTPAHFGANKSHAVIGVQMASAYLGTLIMPPLFGLIANNLGLVWLPVYIMAIVVMMFAMHKQLIVRTSK
ncbi:MAG: MFS transporter [Eubacteriales bacterium]|nr:MFS transporter [Eubacteriales bacterium]